MANRPFDRDWDEQNEENRQWSRGRQQGEPERWRQDPYRERGSFGGEQERSFGQYGQSESERGRYSQGYGEYGRGQQGEFEQGRFGQQQQRFGQTYGQERQFGQGFGGRQSEGYRGYQQTEFQPYISGQQPGFSDYRRGSQELGRSFGQQQGFGQFGQGQQQGHEQLGQGQYGSQFGQQQGRFSGRGPRSYRRPDERIQDEVNERLTMHPDIDASDIEVIVQNAEVTLKGTADDRWAKRLAEDIAESVFGVKEVNNQIRVKQQQSWGGIGQGLTETDRESEFTGAGKGKSK